MKIKDLSQSVLEMLASLNSMNRRKDRLIEITADGVISDDELEDFIRIREELERISIAVETLQLWSERMLATGAINPEQYEAYERRRAERDGTGYFAAAVEIEGPNLPNRCWKPLVRDGRIRVSRESRCSCEVCAAR